MLDEFTKQHLDKYLENYIREDHHEAFRAYALSRAEEDGDYWLNIGWSVLYGNFLMKN